MIFAPIIPQGQYEVQMTAPDVSGVFKFQLDYQRPGLTHLHLEEPAPIRPYRHNEFERFIPAAFPYYAAIACSGAGFFIFSAVLLYFECKLRLRSQQRRELGPVAVLRCLQHT